MTHTPNPNPTPLERAAGILGGWKPLAEKLGITAGTIWLWRTKRDNRVTGPIALAIEHVTHGRVTASELRPDLFPPRNGV